MSAHIHTGDCRDILELMYDDNTFDACVTDPPYGLTFMGKGWDRGVPGVEFWTAIARTLKPGAHLLAFGGTRTCHRLVCAIEDAGFEIRDQIGWAYGSGFPKSSNQKDGWEGWGTAFKPAWEPICVARKPLIGTVPQNLAKWGVGAINIDGCRVPTDAPRPGRSNAESRNGLTGTGGAITYGAYAVRGSIAVGDTTEGRWPANLIHDGSDEVLACFPDAKGQIAAASSSSETRKTQTVYGAMKRGNNGAEPRGDSGSAARFFYCAKASRSDRNDGLDAFEEKPLLWSSGTKNPGSFQSEGTKKAAQNPHPTVKPTSLMQYLCRLVTPPGGHVLDPFMGSGSTGRGAVLEGFRFTGIELEAKYAEIAKARVAASAGRGT